MNAEVLHPHNETDKTLTHCLYMCETPIHDHSKQDES